MIEQQEIVLNQLAFTYLAAGPQTGTPAILLHGFPQFADVWVRLLHSLGASGFRAVALDQRGYSRGARPPHVAAYAVEQLVSDALALADHFRWPHFHLVGHDWGGFIAWALGAKHPHRVKSLAVLSTPHVDALLKAVASDPDQKNRSQYIQFFKMPGHAAESYFLQDGGERLRAVFQGKVPEAQIVKNVQRLLEPGALAAILNWYRTLDVTLRIGPVDVPSLYIWGDHDGTVGRTAAEATKHFVRGPYRFKELAGQSHWLQDEAPDSVNSLVSNHMVGAEK